MVVACSRPPVASSESSSSLTDSLPQMPLLHRPTLAMALIIRLIIRPIDIV